MVDLSKRDFITLLGGAAAAWPLNARAQQQRMRRIGVIMPLVESDPEARTVAAAFERRFESIGWAISRNLQIDYRFAPADGQRIEKFARELVESHVDLIVARSTPVLAGVLEWTRTIPIVFTQVVDAERQRFVKSFSHPGGNATGISNFEPSFGGKWLELLKHVAPHVEKAGVMFNPAAAPYVNHFLRAIEAAAPSFAVKPVATPIHSSIEIEHAIDSFASERNGGLVVVPDAFTIFHRRKIIASAAKHRVPTIYPFRVCAADGGLIAYGADPTDAFRQAAWYVDRVLKGTKPADLPVQVPTKFPLVINLKTAKALGLDIPVVVLARADEVIE
jgi:putative tryptophan/tyrosine transport system substrate-binding protein